MYRCEICGNYIQLWPIRKKSNIQPDGVIERGYEIKCPYCEAPENYINEVEE